MSKKATFNWSRTNRAPSRNTRSIYPRTQFHSTAAEGRAPVAIIVMIAYQERIQIVSSRRQSPPQRKTQPHPIDQGNQGSRCTAQRIRSTNRSLVMLELGKCRTMDPMRKELLLMQKIRQWSMLGSCLKKQELECQILVRTYQAFSQRILFRESELA